jgi:neutral ceramidase
MLAYALALPSPSQAMLSGQPVVSSVRPPDLLSQQISLLGPVVMDTVPHGAAFGDVLLQPLPAYEPGQQVEAVFRCADKLLQNT